MPAMRAGLTRRIILHTQLYRFKRSPPVRRAVCAQRSAFTRVRIACRGSAYDVAFGIDHLHRAEPELAYLILDQREIADHYPRQLPG
jgi:hypothetical protein